MGREGYILRAYRDFCAQGGEKPIEPCPWTWEQAVAFRQGQRLWGRIDKDRRIAAKYFPQEKAPVPQPSTPLGRVTALERDVEALLRHRHQGLEPRPQSKRRIES